MLTWSWNFKALAVWMILNCMNCMSYGCHCAPIAVYRVNEMYCLVPFNLGDWTASNYGEELSWGPSLQGFCRNPWLVQRGSHRSMFASGSCTQYHSRRACEFHLSPDRCHVQWSACHVLFASFAWFGNSHELIGKVRNLIVSIGIDHWGCQSAGYWLSTYAYETRTPWCCWKLWFGWWNHGLWNQDIRKDIICDSYICFLYYQASLRSATPRAFGAKMPSSVAAYLQSLK